MSPWSPLIGGARSGGYLLMLAAVSLLQVDGSVALARGSRDLTVWHSVNLLFKPWQCLETPQSSQISQVSRSSASQWAGWRRGLVGGVLFFLRWNIGLFWRGMTGGLHALCNLYVFLPPVFNMMGRLPIESTCWTGRTYISMNVWVHLKPLTSLNMIWIIFL